MHKRSEAAIERHIEAAIEGRLHNPSVWEVPDWARVVMRRLGRLQFVENVQFTRVGGGLGAVDFDLWVPGFPEGSVVGPLKYIRDMGLRHSGIVLHEDGTAREFLLRLPPVLPDQDVDAVEELVKRMIRQNAPPTELGVMIAEDRDRVSRNLQAFTPHVGYEHVTTARRSADDMIDFTIRLMEDYLDAVLDGPVGLIVDE